MDVTLGDIERVSAEAAVRVREAIRQGALPADRKAGVAGRPYLVRTEDVVAWDGGLEPIMRRVAEDEAGRDAASGGEGPGRRMSGRARRLGAREGRPVRGWMEPDGPEGRETVGRLLALMESQAAMMRTLVDGMNRANGHREDRLDKMQDELQQMSYKLGQAHQEIGRLERHLADRQGLLARAGEA